MCNSSMYIHCTSLLCELWVQLGVRLVTWSRLFITIPKQSQQHLRTSSGRKHHVSIALECRTMMIALSAVGDLIIGPRSWEASQTAWRPVSSASLPAPPLTAIYIVHFAVRYLYPAVLLSYSTREDLRSGRQDGARVLKNENRCLGITTSTRTIASRRGCMSGRAVARALARSWLASLMWQKASPQHTLPDNRPRASVPST